jgi:YVTN family beta-propeller protein
MRALVLLVGIGLAACSRGGSERVYVSDEDGGAIVVLDAAHDEVVARIPVGKRPRGLKISPDGKRLFVALSGSPKSPPGADPASIPPADRSADGIGVVDLDSRKLLRVIPGGQDPETFDVSRDGRRLWVSNEETAEASLVDVDAARVVLRAKVGQEPEGVTIHPDGNVVYVTNEEDDTLSVLDAETGAAKATLAVCARPRAVAFTPDGALGFITCENDSSVAVVDAKTHERRAVMPLPAAGTRPMGVAMTRDGGTLFVSGGRGGDVHEIDVASQTVRRSLPGVGRRPWGLALSRDGSRLYTANGPSGDVSVIDTRNGKVIRTVPVGGAPWGVAVR